MGSLGKRWVRSLLQTSEVAAAENAGLLPAGEKRCRQVVRLPTHGASLACQRSQPVANSG